MREKTGFSFPVKELELHLDASDLSSCKQVNGVVLNIVALGPHVPSYIESLLDQGDSPSATCILPLQRINLTLMGIGTFEDGPTQKKLIPPDAV